MATCLFFGYPILIVAHTFPLAEYHHEEILALVTHRSKPHSHSMLLSRGTSSPAKGHHVEILLEP